MSEHYLDNASTTKVCDSACAAMVEMLSSEYGNPSSLHLKGYKAEKRMTEAKEVFAKLLQVKSKELYLTSCATESTNTFLTGAAHAYGHQGKHILTSKTEHSATYETLKLLSSQGYEIETIENDSCGRVLLDDLQKKIRPDTILVSVLHVNNELGTINPVAEMGKRIHQTNPHTLFHVDAVQSFCKLDVFPKQMNMDALSISCHKCNGPKGTGLLYVSESVRFLPLIVGGGQESGLRSGTQNVAGLVASSVACSELFAMKEENAAKWHSYKKELMNLLSDLDGVYINGPSLEEGCGHILNLRFDKVRSEVLLHALEQDGIYISSGSACSSNKPEEKSRALASIGCSLAEIDSSIRISFGRYSTIEDVMALSDALHKQIPLLRRFVIK